MMARSSDGAALSPTGAPAPSTLFANVYLYRVTTDYAWDYTHPPIIPGGYDVTIPPPAAHLAMEDRRLR